MVVFCSYGSITAGVLWFDSGILLVQTINWKSIVLKFNLLNLAAGRIYFDKCRDPKKAGDCFTSAKSYELAAKAYADGHYFLECLSACTQGNLFEMGRQYIKKWKQAAGGGNGTAKQSKKIKQAEQEFLESCALSYYKLKGHKSMTKYVKALLTMDSRRKFLKSIGCLDELLLLEEEFGNFKEAVEIAKLRGDYERAGMISQCPLSYIFFNTIIIDILLLYCGRERGWGFLGGGVCCVGTGSLS